jgi:hypothetical protein
LLAHGGGALLRLIDQGPPRGGEPLGGRSWIRRWHRVGIQG